MSEQAARIRIIGDPVLRKKARNLEFPDDVILVRKLAETMGSTLKDAEGLGLAAPQIGVSVRLFVALPDYLDELNGHVVFVNPEIDPYGVPEKREEGCLSIPGVYESVFRPPRVKVRALDALGHPFTLDLGGLAARLVQHETDHLNGVLFVDRLSPIRKRLLRGRLKRLREKGET